MLHDPSLLELPAREAARRLVRRQLETARAEAPRLHDAADAEALHDFRVALRRLRSLLRAWRKVLAPLVGRAERDELKAVQAETGAGRDAEVALLWLAEQEAGLAAHERAGADWLRGVLEQRLGAALDHARERVAARFEEADAHLSRRLDGPAPAESGGRGARPFARAAARSLRRHEKAVRELLLGADERPQAARLHAGRIATKRLRYLVEPLCEDTAGARALVEACKKLQDVLGDLNDTAVLEAELERLAAEAPDPARPGLAAVRRGNEERRRELLGRLDRNWVEPRLDRLERPTRALVTELKAARSLRPD